MRLLVLYSLPIVSFLTGIYFVTAGHYVVGGLLMLAMLPLMLWGNERL